MTHTATGAEQRPSALPKPPTFQDNKMYLVARLGDDIGPYLADTPEDRMSVRLMGWNIVAAHAPQTEAEVLRAGRIVSLSFTLLDVLNDARKRDLAPALKLKYLATAVAVNRTICDAERTLEGQKRAHREERRQVHRAEATPHDPDLDERVTAMAEAAMADYREAVAERRAAEAAAHAPLPGYEPGNGPWDVPGDFPGDGPGHSPGNALWDASPDTHGAGPHTAPDPADVPTDMPATIAADMPRHTAEDAPADDPDQVSASAPWHTAWNYAAWANAPSGQDTPLAPMAADPAQRPGDAEITAPHAPGPETAPDAPNAAMILLAVLEASYAAAASRL